MTTDGLVAEIAACKNQREGAALYDRAMRLPPHDTDKWDWSRINAAVTARWPKGLVRVKCIAWKMREA